MRLDSRHNAILALILLGLATSCSGAGAESDTSAATARPAAAPGDRAEETTPDDEPSPRNVGAPAASSTPPPPRSPSERRAVDFDALPDTPSGIFSSNLAAFDTVTHIPVSAAARNGLDILNRPVAARAELKFGVNLPREQRERVERFLDGAQNVVDYAWESGDHLIVRFDASASRAKLVGDGPSSMLITGRLRSRGFLPAMLSERTCAMFAETMPSQRTRQAARWACHGDLSEIRSLGEARLTPDERIAHRHLRRLTFQSTRPNRHSGSTPRAVSNEVLVHMADELFRGDPLSALAPMTPAIRRACNREPDTACRLSRILAQGAYEQALAGFASNVDTAPDRFASLKNRHGWAFPPGLDANLVMAEAEGLRRAQHHAEAVENYQHLLDRPKHGGEELVLNELASTYRSGGDSFRATAVTDFLNEKFSSRSR